jgi:hypothetical protein
VRTAKGGRERREVTPGGPAAGLPARRGPCEPPRISCAPMLNLLAMLITLGGVVRWLYLLYRTLAG